jgi:hypothetical protein
MSWWDLLHEAGPLGLDPWPEELEIEGDLTLDASDWRRPWDGRTLTLPEGLRVGGTLTIEGIMGKERVVDRLPRGLRLGGSLEIRFCASPSRLPEGLVIGGSLFAERWGFWDEVIPKDAKIAGRIYTERFPMEDEGQFPEGDSTGLSLNEWHRAFPNSK